MNGRGELALRGVSKRFGGVAAVQGLDLYLSAGELRGLIGPNGAGKTTVLNLICGLTRADAGEILWEGAPLTGLAPEAVVRRGVARTFQNIRLFPALSALENVCIALDLHAEPLSPAWVLLRDLPGVGGRWREAEERQRQEALALLELTGLRAQALRKAGELAYGHQRRLELARALALSPRLLLLDEPAAGMNERETLELGALIADVCRGRGLSVLLIEHHMELVMSLCDSVTVLNFGKKLAEGPPAAVRSDPAVLAAYLGGEGGGAAC